MRLESERTYVPNLKMAARLTNFTHLFDKPRNGFERIDVYGAFYAKEYIDTYYDFEEKGIFLLDEKKYLIYRKLF